MYFYIYIYILGMLPLYTIASSVKCIFCKNYIRPLNGMNKINDFGKCKLFTGVLYKKEEEEEKYIREEEDYIKEEKIIIYEYAKHCRENKDLCGKNGCLYERTKYD
jgi:hypothetical protein